MSEINNCRKYLTTQNISKEQVEDILRALNKYPVSDWVTLVIGIFRKYKYFEDEPPYVVQKTGEKMLELSYKLLNETIRHKNLRALVNSFLKYGMPKNDCISYGQLVESQCWDEFSDIYDMDERYIVYEQRCGTIGSLLHTSAGEVIVQKLTLGINIGALSERLMIPNEFKSIIDNISARKQQQIKVKTSTLYICPKCGHNESTYFEKQERSIDEAATVICTCVKCTTTYKR